MSGIETFGAIGALVSIIDSATNIWENTQKTTLSSTFIAAANELPVLLETLRKCEKQIRSLRPAPPADVLDALHELMESCERDASALKDILQKTLSIADGRWRVRYRQAIEKNGTGRMEDLLKQIAQQVQKIIKFSRVKIPDVVSQLDGMISKLQELPSSLEDQTDCRHSFTSFGGSQAYNVGSGTQNAHFGSGPAIYYAGGNGEPPVFNFGRV